MTADQSARRTALTSVITGTTAEGFDVDEYPNKLVSFDVDEQILISYGAGGKLPCDWVPRPRKKVIAVERRFEGGRQAYGFFWVFGAKKNCARQADIDAS